MPNFDDVVANASTILRISSADWEISAISPARSSFVTRIFVVLFFALKEDYILALDVDSVPMFLKAS